MCHNSPSKLVEDGDLKIHKKNLATKNCDDSSVILAHKTSTESTNKEKDLHCMNTVIGIYLLKIKMCRMYGNDSGRQFY